MFHCSDLYSINQSLSQPASRGWGRPQHAPTSLPVSDSRLHTSACLTGQHISAPSLMEIMCKSTVNCSCTYKGGDQASPPPHDCGE